MNRQYTWTAYRLGFALLTLAALIVQFLTSRAHPPFSPLNFFSFLTTLSNLLGVLVFLGVGLGARRTLAVDLLRGAVTLYLFVGFLVYVLLLSDIPLGILQPWVNAVLHYVMPIAVAVDWVLSPPRHRLHSRQASLWLALPFVFVIYSEIRGANIGWYPYPFLDPGKVGGYGGVMAYCAVIMLVFVAFAVLLTWLGNTLGSAAKKGKTRDLSVDEGR
ncbi:MAG TPA: Pr6Pr family membrane protein [Candidatus Acidoferrales bacterium]